MNKREKMLSIPASYVGREQALIKHTLLKSYLEKLLLIVGMAARSAGQVEICFVDCFAGPWGTDDEDLDGTSIALSLATLDSCRERLASLGVTATMRALFVEQDPSAFGRLSKYLQSKAPSAVQHACLQGDFIDLRGDILDWCGGQAFAFFFVDPKGWKDVGADKLRPLLSRPRSELLVNFAYNFVNRTASMREWRDAMVDLLGAQIDLDGLVPVEREAALVNAYREGLKSRMPSGRRQFHPRSAYVTVMDPVSRRTKYHLVYVTMHPTGIVEFLEISEKVELVQRQVRNVKRAERRREETGVADMFADHLPPETELPGKTAADVDAFWLDHLRDGPVRIGTGEFADILESRDCFPSDLQASLARLVKAGLVVNLDADARRRRTRPLHFENAERLGLGFALGEPPS